MAWQRERRSSGRLSFPPGSTIEAVPLCVHTAASLHDLPSERVGSIGSMNNDGTSANLVAAHPGNRNAVRSGIFSRTGRVLAPRAREIADELMTAPHVSTLDATGAEEIGALIALIEAMDADIAERGLTRRGDARALVKLRLQASRRLQDWLAAYGMTPRSRAEFLREHLAGRSLIADLNRRRADAEASE
jgi:hypothetical protein